MARRIKLTAFTRFLLVMIILVPLAFVGASLYNGKDPIVEAKKLLGMEETTQTTQQTKTTDNADRSVTANGQDQVQPSDIQVQMKDMKKRIEQLERDNLELQKKLKQYEVEIKELKRQQAN